LTIVSLAVLAWTVGCSTGSITGSDGGRERYAEEWQETADQSGLNALSAETINGNIEVVAASTAEVQIDIRKQVRAATEVEAEAFAESVVVTVKREGTALRVFTEYPQPLPQGIEVTVDLQIRCPAELALALVTANGNVSVEGAHGAISAVTINGDVSLDGCRGTPTVGAVNGSVTADIDDLQGPGSFATVNGNVEVTVRAGVASVSASTGNGNIVVRLHSSYAGQLYARVHNGHIDSRIAVNATESTADRLRGQIGSGGEATVQLQTTNGDIDVRRA
jgi:DUF4097 and DUF4098 domain-containing protein YvlB